jgi:hypothetical protein
LGTNIPINDFERYIKTLCEVSYILKGEVIKVNKSSHKVDVKVYSNTKETGLILSNVYVPFIWGLNDEPGLKCLVGLEEGDRTRAYVLAFFSSSKDLVIDLDGIKLEIKDKIKITGDLEVTGNIKASGNVEDVNGTMQDMRMTFNTHTHSFTCVKEGSTGTTNSPSSSMS